MANGQCIVVVPPEESIIASDWDVNVVRVFDASTEDFATLAVNAADSRGYDKVNVTATRQKPPS